MDASEQVVYETLQDVLKRATVLFTEYFDSRAIVAARAPGRINLVGDHTESADGLVLPMTIDRNVVMVGRPNHSRRCRIVAADLGGEMANFMNIGDLAPSRTLWVNLVKGVVAQFNVNGHAVPSFDAVIASPLPIGAGLAGSTAIAVAAATFIETLLGIRLTSLRKAQWCQASRRSFLGDERASIVDPLICAAGQRKHALLIDTRNHKSELVPLNRADVTILVTDTMTRRRNESDVDELTTQRAAEFAEATKIVAAEAPHVQSLRDVTLTQVERMRDALGPKLLHRARHAILESQRAGMVAESLQRDDYATAGFLMYESHRSLRDECEVSSPELDALVELAIKHKGVFGSRMTGPGGGGCTVTLVRTETCAALIEHLQRGFREQFGRECRCDRVIPVGGARSVQIVPHSLQ